MTSGTLYLIPVPLGHISPEASLPAPVLAQIRRLSHFVVENAKSARAFLKAAGTEQPLQALQLEELNEHTRPDALDRLLAPLRAGHDLGLLSEAGCPAVADPGANLVALAQNEGIRVAPLIGPSSLLLALMASGLNGQRFAFQGYLPAKDAERAKALREIEIESRKRGQTQIFIETPYRNRPAVRQHSPDLSAGNADCGSHRSQPAWRVGQDAHGWSVEKTNAARNRAASDGFSAACLSVLSAG